MYHAPAANASPSASGTSTELPGSSTPSVPKPSTPADEARLAIQQGQTYEADPQAPAATPKAARPNGAVDFGACRARPLGHRDQGQVIDHFHFCRWGIDRVVQLEGDGRVAGTVTFTETEVGLGSVGTRDIQMDVQLTNVKPTGVFDEAAVLSWDVTAAGSPSAQACRIGGSTHPYSAPVAAWPDIFVGYDLRSPKGSGDGIDDIATCVWNNHYMAIGAEGPTVWSDGPEAGARFDSSTYLARPAAGAIFDRVTPYMTYHLADKLVVGVAFHIYFALNLPQFTFPPQTINRMKRIPGNIRATPPSLIHRLYAGYDAAAEERSKENRAEKDAACARLTRPAGTDCDEYPFASSWEGAGLGDGNFSVMYVDSAQNQKAGSRLSEWYGNDRILNRDAFGMNIVF
ncbi:NucA/NucB deoxyribonuclease domain-containing protein [Streptomyces hygroscopicus]|uniref:NucA/NucB deoxyribonuclease domain-containing protein n=1 Tax=Streptomyces hygroscopicus TaxID=1912 RepID=UPI00223F6620|nr:NucA/NucB deoxyribonuclease domain-containing protein [Streptomyces hygroscopicus]